RLREGLGAGRDSILLATTACGAIPYYSGMPTIDMHGLMDRWITRYGAPSGLGKPGHLRIATLDYLIRRRVNLVLGHPHIELVQPEVDPWPLGSFASLKGWDGRLPPGVELVEVPLSPRYAMTMLYLTRTPLLDS